MQRQQHSLPTDSSDETTLLPSPSLYEHHHIDIEHILTRWAEVFVRQANPYAKLDRILYQGEQEWKELYIPDSH